MLINISRKRFITPKAISASSCDPAYSSSIKTGKWKSASLSKPENEFLLFEFDSELFFSYIEISSNPARKGAFPEDFRIDISLDGKEWSVLHTETAYISQSDIFAINLPLVSARFARIYITKCRQTDSHFFAEFERVLFGISGIHHSGGCKDLSHDKRKEFLFDGKADTFFESEHFQSAEKILMTFDLGFCYPLSAISLKAPETNTTGFPSDFSIEVSPDKKLFTYACGQKHFSAEAGGSYSFSFDTLNARYIRFETEAVSLGDKDFAIRIAEMNFFASPMERTHSHAGLTPPYASVFLPGVVRMAKDGEVSDSAVVRSDDRRLKDASNLFKGIVIFANNGESKDFTAVQASDNRLKPATESSNGTVRLAYDREQNPKCAVQGSDSRLREATEQSFGIVRICPDGEAADLGVVRGNDKRLKLATEKTYGITRLAEDGSAERGLVVQGNDKRLKDASVFSKGIVQFAANGSSEADKAVSADDRRLKDATTKSKGIVMLSEDGASEPDTAVQANDSRLKPATTASKGIVELAENGETKPGTAVQSDDKRLLDASEKNKGIMIFASDGESSQLKAVQGSDKRLKDATTLSKGIVELAEDGEDAPNVAVQGSDKRIKDATILSKGIMRFADDGEVSPMAALQSSDRRLRDANEKEKGILRFSANGESAPMSAVQSNDDRLKPAAVGRKGISALCPDGEETPGTVVQGSDKRLRRADNLNHGIVRFASNGETASFAAVQSNDDRLRTATTLNKGIVELAEDGEDSPNVAVQGSDKRLKKADVENYGIMRFADDGESKKLHAVQSDDKRLSDKRHPLAHDHDYASKVHEFNSHSGTISIKAERAERYTGITPPPESSSVIYAENSSSESSASAITGVAGKNITGKSSYGVTGHSQFIGVRGQSSGNNNEKGCGVLGVSRFGAGGVFSSEHDFAIVADGFGTIDSYDSSLKLKGEGKAFHAKGKSEFSGQIKINSVDTENEAPSNITEMHIVDQEEFVSAGDILVISENGGTLAKSHIPYNKSVVGIVSGNPSVIMNDSGADKSAYPVALYGTVLVKIDARISPVKPGDFIVTSPTPGCGMKGTVDSFEKTGSVIGKALTGLEGGVGTIKMIIARF